MTSAPTDRVRVLTFNLLAAEHAAGDRRQRVTAAGLAELRPDIVALQEVTRTDAFDQARQLLGPDVTMVDHPSRAADGVGACLATRWPVGGTASLDLRVDDDAEGLPWTAAVAVQVLAPAPLGPLLVVHYKPSWQRDLERVRERQAVAAARWIEDLVDGDAERRVVVLGDFDAAPEAASMRFWTGLQSLEGVSVCYEDAWDVAHPDEPGNTFDPRNPLVRAGEMPLDRGRRIDHVLVRCGPHGPLLDVLDCGLVFDRPVDGAWASDHFGVIADLGLPSHPPGTWAPSRRSE